MENIQDWMKDYRQEVGFDVLPLVGCMKDAKGVQPIVDRIRKDLELDTTWYEKCGDSREAFGFIRGQSYIADPWLIAAAAVNDYTIITAEVPSSGLSPKTQNKSAKIPDVARAFGVKSNNLYYMMRTLGIKI